MSSAAAKFLNPVEFSGAHVRLVPLAASHRDDLVAAVKDGELWRLSFTKVPSPAEMEAEIARRVGLYAATGLEFPFAVIEPSSGKAVGMTNYLNGDAVNRRVEIGATWYAARVQRTALNTEAKLLLLGHAFDALNCIAVELRTNFFNQRSRRAIERLGAKLDGILRNHQASPNGTLRDTCVYSIIVSEWPTVRFHLKAKLEQGMK